MKATACNVSKSYGINKGESMEQFINKEAMHYERRSDKKTECFLCPHNCMIPDGKRGFCGVRKNEDGTLYAESYGQISSFQLDPIEKKPLRMFHSGSMILSLGSYGCNFRCGFCQNHSISIERPETAYLSPEEVVYEARKHIPYGNIGVAYTYNEPLIGYEYVYDCAGLIHDAGMKNVVVTNGYICPKPLEQLLPRIDAMNIDLKSITPGFYNGIKGDVDDVLESIHIADAAKTHVEVTTLIIPDENDSPDEMELLSAALARINPGIPLHITMFRPRYKMSDKNPTTYATVAALKAVAERNLSVVFA